MSAATWRLHVGTSGWAYPEWRGSFYPPRLPQSDFLSFYGGALGACEVNATFYRAQPGAVLERWAAAVPPSFRFTVKAHRRLTYRKQLAPDAATEAFVRDFATSLAPLGEKLGCLLVQVPEFAERDDAALAALLDLLPGGLPFACEFLHPRGGRPRSWTVSRSGAERSACERRRAPHCPRCHRAGSPMCGSRASTTATRPETRCASSSSERGRIATCTSSPGTRTCRRTIPTPASAWPGGSQREGRSASRSTCQ